MPRFGVTFRDPAALERVLGRVSKRPHRAKQLSLGLQKRARACLACARQMPKGASACPDCGAFVCLGCDEVTTANGGSDGHCLECLVAGREADPRVDLAAAE